MQPCNVSKVEIQGIFAEGASSYLEAYPTNKQQRKAIYAITNCRGPRLGKHIDKCDRCGYQEISYNSCRNRHCPKCQHSKSIEWVSQLKGILPPVRYFHLVFTLPHKLNELVYKNQKDLYPILFRASAQTVMQVAARPGFLGAQTGCLSVLHTWGQNLQYHPHIHMLVPAGGMSEDNMEWIHSGKKFFAPVKILSRVFRGKFSSMLESLTADGIINADLPAMKAELYKKDWVVYAKKPFAGPAQIINYLGRYTHRIAISNSRIINHQNNKVLFWWKDYRSKASWKTMQLDTSEFIRRFLLHVLPCNFYKIRYYGILALAHRNQALLNCRTLIQRQKKWEPPIEIQGSSIPVAITRKCPHCNIGKLAFYKLLLPGGG